MNLKTSSAALLIVLATSGVAFAGQAKGDPAVSGQSDSVQTTAPSAGTQRSRHSGRSWTAKVHGRVVAVKGRKITVEQRVRGGDKSFVYTVSSSVRDDASRFDTVKPGDRVTGKARISVKSRQGHRHTSRRLLELHVAHA